MRKLNYTGEVIIWGHIGKDSEASLNSMQSDVRTYIDVL